MCGVAGARLKRSSSRSEDDGSESESVVARERLCFCSRHICSESRNAIASYDKPSKDRSNYENLSNIGYGRNDALCMDEQFRHDMIKLVVELSPRKIIYPNLALKKYLAVVPFSSPHPDSSTSVKCQWTTP